MYRGQKLYQTDIHQGNDERRLICQDQQGKSPEIDSGLVNIYGGSHKKNRSESAQTNKEDPHIFVRRKKIHACESKKNKPAEEQNIPGVFPVIRPCFI